MGNRKFNINQLRADLDNLSAHEFEIKYPGLKSRSLKSLSGEELERRVSKARGGGSHSSMKY